MTGAAGLADRLGYAFRDAALLRAAFTHRSAGPGHNERLEFLGDAVLSFLIAELLLERYPDAREGELSRLRARLVRRETLAALARELGLGERLLLGPGELKSGGYLRESILADAFEALVCAIYLDGGIEVCRERVRAWFAPHLAGLEPGEDLKDPKTRLQELLQARHLGLPDYRLVTADEPPGGTPHFVVECTARGLAAPVRGAGASRRRAEQDAAQLALAALRGARA